MKGIKVLIVDNDPMVTGSLALIIEKSGHRVAGIGNNGQEGVDLYKANKPDVVLMDIPMENKNGIEAVKEIMEFNSSAKILILTTFKDEEYIADALKSGAKGYILKQNVDSLIPSLEAVFAGNSVFDSEITVKINNNGLGEFNDDKLNDREILITGLIAEGFNNKEIADKLYLSEGTLRNYISEILNKLQLRNRTEIAIYYYKKLKWIGIKMSKKIRIQFCDIINKTYIL